MTNVIAETIAPSGAEEKDELEIKPEELEEDENEQVVPALEEEPSEEEIKKASEKKSILEEVSGEPEIVVSKVPEIEVLKQPNPVEGETARERGLRIEIQKLREKVRNKEELIKITPPPMSNEEYEKLREDYTDEELEKVEKLFDVIGKKKGYVKAEEIYAKDSQDTVEAFIEKYPEYKPENDPEDVRWETFKRILISTYNRADKTPKELVKIYEKVHNDVLEEFGEAPKNTIAPKRNAEIQKIRSVSHTGGTKTEVVKKSNAPTDPKVRAMFKDFDDDDF